MVFGTLNFVFDFWGAGARARTETPEGGFEVGALFFASGYSSYCLCPSGQGFFGDCGFWLQYSPFSIRLFSMASEVFPVGPMTHLRDFSTPMERKYEEGSAHACWLSAFALYHLRAEESLFFL